MPTWREQTVTGDADEAREPGVARLDRGAQRAIAAERDRPLGRIDEVVELDEVDVIDAQPPYRQPDLVARLGVGALPRLRGR